MKKKVIISACLLGHLCRYDGKTKKTTEVIDALNDYEIIPFCPEAPLFGTPRDRISVIEVDGNNRIIVDKTKKDVTSVLEDEINRFVSINLDIEKIVLKSKSPSCGYGTTPILNADREFLYYGNGIAAEIFLGKFSNIEIIDESKI